MFTCLSFEPESLANYASAVKKRCEPKNTQNQADFQKCSDFDHFMKSIATPAVRFSVFQRMKLHG